MSLESKIAEYQKAAQIIAQCNAFQATSFSSITINSSDSKVIDSNPFYMGNIDVSLWITNIRNQANAKRTALKQEIIDILNSGV